MANCDCAPEGLLNHTWAPLTPARSSVIRNVTVTVCADELTSIDVGAKLKQFDDRPVLIAWGMRDFVFDEHFLRVWERELPHAEVHRFHDAGHYVLEDAGAEIEALVVEFLARGANA